MPSLLHHQPCCLWLCCGELCWCQSLMKWISLPRYSVSKIVWVFSVSPSAFAPSFPIPLSENKKQSTWRQSILFVFLFFFHSLDRERDVTEVFTFSISLNDFTPSSLIWLSVIRHCILFVVLNGFSSIIHCPGWDAALCHSISMILRLIWHLLVQWNYLPILGSS